MTSWPEPEPGLVIRYAYLWRREQEAGREERAKDRPCAIVLALAGLEDDRPRVVVVLAVTHTPPQPPTEGVELPVPVTRRLGLDEERSWVIVSEANMFLWPGPDLRFLPGRGPGSAAYGLLPPDVFRAVRERFLQPAGTTGVNRAAHGVGAATRNDVCPDVQCPSGVTTPDDRDTPWAMAAIQIEAAYGACQER